MRRISSFCLTIALWSSIASAQVEVPPFEVLEYVPQEFGTIYLSTSTPGFTDKSPTAYLTGPNGFFESYEAGDTTLLENLPPGVYSLAVTDETFRMVEGKVEVLPGQVAIVAVALSYVGGYYADTADLEIFGLFEFQLSDWDEQDNRALVSTNVEAVVSVTGPDGYHRDFTGEQAVEVSDLEDGTYSVAATAPGFGLVEGRFRVANGQEAMLRLTLEPWE